MKCVHKHLKPQLDSIKMQLTNVFLSLVLAWTVKQDCKPIIETTLFLH